MTNETVYPGVYIQEISQGPQVINGIDTSITAFVGRAKRGPTDQPVTLTSFSEYESIFGGLDETSAMSFAVRDFFLNGGARAIICRLYRPENYGTGKSTIAIGDLEFEAANEGLWGNSLRVRVDYNVDSHIADSLGVTTKALFNLQVNDGTTGYIESFSNLCIKSGSQQVDKVLQEQSVLIRLKGRLPQSRPPASSDPAPGDDRWADNQVATNYTVSNLADNDEMLELSDYIDHSRQWANRGLFMLLQIDNFSLLCLPPDWNTLSNDDYPSGLVSAAVKLCEKQRAMLIVDPPKRWTDAEKVKLVMESGLLLRSPYAAMYFPRIRQVNPLNSNQIVTRVPCGAIAGVIAEADTQYGVWKAPAGIGASFSGVEGLSINLNDADNDALNSLGVNCLRNFSTTTDPVIWGARTLQGTDTLDSEWKYIAVLRTAFFIEKSIDRGLGWTIFEPNNEVLWAQIRMSINNFMQGLFVQGAFQGTSSQQAYFVKCDQQTTTRDDINQGIINIQVGFAALKPAEFVILHLKQRAESA